MKIVQLLRVKNGEPFIENFMELMSKIIDGFFIIDDNSADDTYKICKSYDKVIKIETYNREFHGGRDRAELFQWLRDYYKNFNDNDIWCTVLDHDEIFENKAIENFRKELENISKEERCIQYPAYTMWNDDKHYAASGMYIPKTFIRSFRFNEHYIIDNTRKFHSIAVPLQSLNKDPSRDYYLSNIRIKHFGYMFPDERKRKYDFYTKGRNIVCEQEIGAKDYSHMIDDSIQLKEWEE